MTLPGQDTFQRALLISGMAHGIVAMMLFLRAIVMPSDPIDLSNAIRVDMVDLPDKLQSFPATPPPEKVKPEVKVKETPKPVEKPEPVVEKKPEAPVMPDTKAKKKDLSKKQAEAMRKLKAMEALAKMREDLKKDKDAKAAPAVVKGNKVSVGDSPTGLEKLDFDRYISDVKAKVREHNTVPQWLADGGYKTIVKVLIDERGYVTKKEIIGPSGNEVFDAKAIEAIEASSPFPPPPDRLQARLSTIGFQFRFPE